MKKIAAIIEKAPDGGFGIYCKEIAGAVGYGDTEAEAKQNFVENLEEQPAPKKAKKEKQQPITKRVAKEEAKTTVATTEANLQEGDKVAHSKFGEGVVTAITEDKITIDFEEVGEKTMVRKFTKLEKI